MLFETYQSINNDLYPIKIPVFNKSLHHGEGDREEFFKSIEKKIDCFLL
jgi:hypothetical protein